VPKQRKTTPVKYKRHEVRMLLDDAVALESGHSVEWVVFWRNFRKWGLRSAFVLSASAALFYFGNKAVQPALGLVARLGSFEIKTLHLQSNGVLDAKRLMQLVAFDSKQSFWGDKLEEFSARVRSLPNVKDADLQTDLKTGQLHVNLEERIPVALLEIRDLGISAADASNSLLVDAEGYVFKCLPEHLALAAKLPVVELTSRQLSHYPTLGKEIESLHLESMLRLLAATKGQDFAAHYLKRISAPNAWSLRALGQDQCELVFGISEHQRQLQDMELIVKHARSQSKRVAWMNLIPSRNIAVVYAKPQSDLERLGVDEAELAAAMRSDNTSQNTAASPPAARSAPTAAAAASTPSARRSAQNTAASSRSSAASTSARNTTGSNKRATAATNRRAGAAEAPLPRPRVVSAPPAVKPLALKPRPQVAVEQPQAPKKGFLRRMFGL